MIDERVMPTTRTRTRTSASTAARGTRSHGPVPGRASTGVAPRPAHSSPSSRTVPSSRTSPSSRDRHATPQPQRSTRSAATTQSARRPAARAAATRNARPLQKRTIRQRAESRGYFTAGSTHKRLIIVLLVVALVFGYVLVHVAQLQTVDAETYTRAGTSQRTQDAVLHASRGVIFDRNGDELALSVPATTIFVNPKLVGDPAGTAAALATMLGLSPDKQQSLAVAIANKDKSFVYVARQIDDQKAAAVTALKLAGVDSYRESSRVIPGGDLAKSVIGRTNTDGMGTAGLDRKSVV